MALAQNKELGCKIEKIKDRLKKGKDTDGARNQARSDIEELLEGTVFEGIGLIDTLIPHPILVDAKVAQGSGGCADGASPATAGSANAATEELPPVDYDGLEELIDYIRNSTDPNLASALDDWALRHDLP